MAERPPTARTGGEAPSTWQRYRALSRNAEYGRVFAAGLGSVAGSAIAGVALIWIVATVTHSALALAALGIGAVVSSAAFSIFGGALVDRSDPRRLMILSDVGRAAALLVALLFLEFVGFSLALLVGVAAALGAFGTVFNPAENSIIPRLVASGLVADANGLVRSTRSAVQFAGTGVGGALILTVGPLWGIAANVATFALSAALLAGIRRATPAAGRPGTDGGALPGYLADLRAGFRWLRGAAGFLQLTLSATVFNFCSSAIGTFLVLYATDLLHGGAFAFAALLAAEVAGAGLGALLVGPTRAVRWAGRAWTIPYGVVSGALALALPLLPSLPIAVVVLFLLGALGGFAGTAWLTAAQILVPREMQGRYFGVDNLGSVVTIPAAQFGGALLIGALGLGPTYLYFAVVWTIAGVGFLFPRALWRLGADGGPTPRSADGAADRT